MYYNDAMIAILLIVFMAGLAVGWIPGAIAFGRNHKDAAAIMACGLLGILFMPAWIAAFVWALTDRVNHPTHRRRRRPRRVIRASDASDALSDMAG